MGTKGALDSETDAAFIKELDGWAWALPGTGVLSCQHIPGRSLGKASFSPGTDTFP